MPWYDAVAGLTALAAHDASNVSGGALVDRLGGGNPASLSGQTASARGDINGNVYNFISPNDQRVRYTNLVTYPQTGCTVFAFFWYRDSTSFNTLFHASDATGDHLMVFAPRTNLNGSTGGTNARITNEGGTACPIRAEITPVSDRPMFIALTFTGTQGQFYYNGALLGSAGNINSDGSAATGSRGITYDNTWNLKQGLIALGVFQGAATLQQLQDLEAAVRSDLAIGNVTVIDETFATGIPADFNAAWGYASTASGLSATYNATEQAVDLVQPVAQQAYWLIGKSATVYEGEFEVDLQLITDSSGANNYKHAGIWLSTIDGTGQGFRFSHLTTNWQAAYYNNVNGSGESLVLAVPEAANTSFNAGDRRLLKVKLRQSVTDPRETQFEFYVDGILQLRSPYYSFRSPLRMGIFVYQATVRLHSVKQTIGTGINSQASVVGYTLENLGRLFTYPNAPTDLQKIGYEPEYSKRLVRGAVSNNEGPNKPYLLSGFYPNNTPTQGKVSGTTKTSALPSNIPIGCIVALYLDPEGELVAETFSDPATGNYEFDYVPRGRRYMVVAFHPSRTFRAVLADNLLAESVP